MLKSLALVLALMAIATPSAHARTLEIPVAEYRDKVYASWLAQCVGNIYGLPHENQYIDRPGPETFPYGYGRNADELREQNGAFSDDDTDIEYMYLLAMEKYGPSPTYAQLAESWKHHVRDRVWLANRAALAAMHFGFTPPVTGTKAVNPHWFQIDPQLVNEIWGVTAPGMTRYAAEKSDWAARITDDGWGVEPTIHYGAMFSAAFFESDVTKLVDIGTAALPPGSRFAKTVEEMKALHRKYPNDWKAARAEMADRYYVREPAETKTIWNANLNGACGILALLYGGGDFQRTLDLACAMGFDADNQAATMSGLLGAAKGTKGLPHDQLFPFPELGWTKPLNDSYKNVTRFDMPDAGIEDMANRIAEQGEKIILANGGRCVTENGVDYYLIDPNAKFVAPLELPVGPLPIVEAGARVVYDMPVSGAAGPSAWRLVDGALPSGLTFRNGRISGVAKTPGTYPVTIELRRGAATARRRIDVVVRGKNLAPSASEILASVRRTNTARRDAMWLTVPRSLYADSVEVIRDGRTGGDGSTFYSIGDDVDETRGEKTDFYGYAWREPQTIGLVAYHTGAMEENGGWFLTLGVEYRDSNGEWRPVEKLVTSPSLIPGDEPYDKPHFVEYLLRFEPVRTTAIRIVGRAAGTKHWYSKQTWFTSIAELGVYGSATKR